MRSSMPWNTQPIMTPEAVPKTPISKQCPWSPQFMLYTKYLSAYIIPIASNVAYLYQDDSVLKKPSGKRVVPSKSKASQDSLKLPQRQIDIMIEVQEAHYQAIGIAQFKVSCYKVVSSCISSWAHAFFLANWTYDLGDYLPYKKY